MGLRLTPAPGGSDAKDALSNASLIVVIREYKADAAEPAVPGEGGALRDLQITDDALNMCPACSAAKR